MKAAHAIIAEACVLHLNLINSNDTKEATRVDGCESSCEGESAAHVSGSSNRTVFSYYAVANWVFHFRNASIIDGNPLIPLTLNIFERKSQSYSLWLRTFWVHEHGGNPPGGLTDLMVAASLNNRPIIKMLLEHGSEVEAKDTKFKRTPISWAAKSGSEKIIEILLENGADIDSTDIYGRTPLLIATSTGHKHVVKLLLKKGANINAKDRGGWTALTTAMGTGHGDIQNLLTTSEYSQNPT
jgi:ankyrin repeat protein